MSASFNHSPHLINGLLGRSVDGDLLQKLPHRPLPVQLLLVLCVLLSDLRQDELGDLVGEKKKKAEGESFLAQLSGKLSGLGVIINPHQPSSLHICRYLLAVLLGDNGCTPMYSIV